MLCDMGSHVVIVEIDENQHMDYECSCENKRLMQLSQDIGHRPLVFVRFNPDDYEDRNGTTITSCWGYNKKGLAIVKKKKQDEWNERLSILKGITEYWIANCPAKTIEVIQLYYDEVYD